MPTKKRSRSRLQNAGSCRLNLHIETVGQLTLEQAKKLLQPVDLVGAYMFEGPLTVLIDYPLSRVVAFDIVGEVTIAEIIWHTAKKYAEIYAKEERTTKIKIGKIAGLQNRNRTDGVFGVWGHDLGDLWFEGIEVKGGKVILMIGS